MSIFLVDSYSESNRSGYFWYDDIDSDKGSQSFTGKAGNLAVCKWYLRKRGNPTGDIVAKLYTHSGTYGVSSIPNALLATSDVIDIETLSTTFELITFNFTGAEQYLLVEGTYYCLVIEFSGVGDNKNCLEVGVDDSSPTHSGNAADYYNGNWDFYTYDDFIFYVYAEGEEPPEPSGIVKSIAKPISLKTTKEINGAWTANMQILPDDYIGTENYVDIDDEQYVVKNLKKIKSGGQFYYDVMLYHNSIEELTADSIDRFSLLKSVNYLLDYILTDTIWTAGECDIDEIISLITDRRTTILEALNLLAERCGGELYFHSKDRIVDLKRQIGSDTKLQLRYDKNCDYIEKEEDSTDLITRIYPYGPDNFTINTTIIDDCENETLYIPSGAGSVEASDLKQRGSKAIKINAAALNETFIRDLGAGNVKDLSGHDLLKFWIYSELDNALGFTFGIGEGAYTEITVNTGALTAGCWHEITKDISGVPAASKNAIRYIGFKNLTNGAISAIFDSIRAFNGDIYIDSPNIDKYKVNKEYVYNHSAKPEKIQFEKILNPTMDTYTVQLYGGSPNGNYGTEGNLYIRNWPNYSYQTFVKYSLEQIPIGATIISATLGFNVNSLKNGGANISVYLSAADWNEYTLTWNNQPAVSGDSIITLAGTALGIMEGSILTTVQSWFSGSNNYGLILKMDASANKLTRMDSRESSNIKPYCKIIYTLLTDPSPVIEAAAMAYLTDHEESKLKYKVKMADLSKVMVDTWEDETVNLGDTARIYDSELDINVDVRIKKITKNLLDPTDVDLELANKAYSLADLEAKRAKQLSYAMPYQDNPKIISANAIQTGYFGSDVNV